MSRAQQYELKTSKLLEPILERFQYELYDVEFIKEVGTWYLRIYIDKEDGINIQDCEIVSRSLSEILDTDEFIEESYILEVSSPGLGRQLKKDKHLEKSIGEAVEVKLYKPIDKQKEFLGELESFNDTEITIILESGELKTFDRKSIAIIRLQFDF